MKGAAGAMPDQAGDLGLMHREDHRGRRTGAAERVADIGHIRHRGAEAAELDRDLHAEQLLLARCVDRGLWETRFQVDVRGFRCCHGGDSRRPLQEGRAAVEQQAFAGVIRNRVAEARFLDVHG